MGCENIKIDMLEKKILSKVNAMCVESLSPELLDYWELINAELVKNRKYLNGSEEEILLGMYGEAPVVKIGKYTISNNTVDGKDRTDVWIEEADVDGGQFRQSDLEVVIKKFYDDNF